MEFLKSPRHLLKPIFLGDEYVGKTSLICKYTNNKYENKTTIDLFSKEIQINNQDIRLLIWDIKGYGSFEKIVYNYIKDSNAYIILFDLTNLRSFYNINNWLHKIKNNNELFNDYYPILLLGCKKDLTENRKVTFDEAKKFAIFNKLLYAEVSIDEDINRINSLFNTYFNKILNLYIPNDDFKYTNVYQITDNKKNIIVNEEIEFLDDSKYKSKCCYNCKKHLDTCNIQ
jgi:Ras-related protein Rab-18